MWAWLRQRNGKQDGQESPFRAALRLILAQAVKDGSPLVCFGIPHESPVAPQQGPPPPGADDPALAAQLAELAGGTAGEAERKLWEQSGELRYWNGCDHMPLWYVVQGRWYEMMPLADIYSSLTAITQLREMLVSLNASPNNPQPMRYVELFGELPGCRRFVEVQLVIDEDNTFRIKLLQYREEPVSVIASADFRGLCPVPPPTRLSPTQKPR